MAVRQLNRITDEMYLPRREIDPQRRRVPIWEALESWACRRRCYRKPIVTVTPITCMERQLPSEKGPGCFGAETVADLTKNRNEEKNANDYWSEW